MKINEKEITEFIGTSASFDDYGGYIWGNREDGHLQMIGEVRGWGAIQNLFKDANGNFELEKAEEFQDALGNFIVDAINEKIERIK